MKLIPIKTRIFLEKESLTDFIFKHIPKLENGDIIVVTSKIVALAQGRVSTDLTSKETLIKQDSTATIKTPWCTMGLINGRWSANAGVDHSNSHDKLIRFPLEVDQVALKIQQALIANYGLQKCAVVITDSRTTPLRSGVTVSAVASAGLEILRSYVGQPDLTGIPMKFTKLNVVDSLAAAAGLLMGEGSEQIPLLVVQNAPVEFTHNADPVSSLNIEPHDDLYYEIFRSQTE